MHVDVQQIYSYTEEDMITGIWQDGVWILAGALAVTLLILLNFLNLKVLIY